MVDSSVVSEFQFKSYKVDKFVFKSQPKVNLLARVEGFKPDEWEFQFNFRVPVFFKKNSFYTGGMDILAFVPDPENKGEEENPAESALVSIEAGIAGIFTTKGQFPPRRKKNWPNFKCQQFFSPICEGLLALSLRIRALEP